MKIIFGAVVYEGAKKYLPEFFESIRNQSVFSTNTDFDFEILLLNDNCDTDELNKMTEEGLSSVNYVIKDFSDRKNAISPAGFRVELLLMAKKENADLLIIGDADDLFEKDRIKAVTNAYIADADDEENGAAFYYNQLRTFDGKDIFKSLPEEINPGNIMDEISQGNFLGMSITAIDMRRLDKKYIDSLREADVVAFDWYLFTRIIMDIGYGKYIDAPDTATLYRIYDNNAAGVDNQEEDFVKTKIEKEIGFKLMHYKLLKNRYIDYSDLYDDLQELYNVSAGISDEEEWLSFWKCYQNLNPSGLWWNLISL